MKNILFICHVHFAIAWTVLWLFRYTCYLLVCCFLFFFLLQNMGWCAHILILVKNACTTSKHGTGLAHHNIRHHSNKITKVSNMIYNDNIPYHIFEFSETWTNVDIPDNYFFTSWLYHCTKRFTKPYETELLIHVKNGISFNFFNFSNTGIESPSSVVIDFVYRHPKCSLKWFDDFVRVSYNLCQCISLTYRQELLLLLEQQSISPSSFTEMFVLCIGVSDHHATCLT